MGLLSTLRLAPKSDKIRAQLETTEKQVQAAESRVATAKETWRKTVLEGSDTEKASARSALRKAEYDHEELTIERTAMVQLLADTERQEAEQAARDDWNGRGARYIAIEKEAEKCVREAAAQIEKLVGTLRRLRLLEDEGKDLVLTADREERRDQFLEAFAGKGSELINEHVGWRFTHDAALVRLPNVLNREHRNAVHELTGSAAA